jgi:hypothetical protein
MRLTVFGSVLITLFLSACSGDIDMPAKSTVKYERIGGQGKVHFVYIEPSPSINKNSYREVADIICERERICIVMFWNERNSMPSSIPMTDAQVNSKVAHYNLNKNTGVDRVLICAADGC